MANPRQRRKQKSRSHRSVRTTSANKLKKHPVIRGPRGIQDAWDRKKTLRQNYASLGLALDTSATSNGATIPNSVEGSDVGLGSEEQGIPSGHGRILRDDDGRIVGVEIAEEKHEKILQEAAPSTEVVEALETLSKQEQKREMHASQHEITWLRGLIEKHGDDLEAMSKDRKQNPWQRTVGELRRAINKGGGIDRLLSGI